MKNLQIIYSILIALMIKFVIEEIVKETAKSTIKLVKTHFKDNMIEIIFLSFSILIFFIKSFHYITLVYTPIISLTT